MAFIAWNHSRLFLLSVSVNQHFNCYSDGVSVYERNMYEWVVYMSVPATVGCVSLMGNTKKWHKNKGEDTPKTIFKVSTW